MLHFETNGLRGINVVMKRDIAQFAPFKNRIEPGSFFDITTPYGYGGFLLEGNTSESALKELYERYTEFAKNEKVVSEFVRYHPQLKNAEFMRSVSTVVDLGKNNFYGPGICRYYIG